PRSCTPPPSGGARLTPATARRALHDVRTHRPALHRRDGGRGAGHRPPARVPAPHGRLGGHGHRAHGVYRRLRQPDDRGGPAHLPRGAHQRRSDRTRPHRGLRLSAVRGFPRARGIDASGASGCRGSPMIRRLLLASRPVSWINTAYPFAAAYLLTARQVDAAFVVGTLFFLIPYNLAMYGINDVFDYESDLRNPRKGGAHGAVLDRRMHRITLWTAALTCLPFVVYLVVV